MRFSFKIFIFVLSVIGFDSVAKTTSQALDPLKMTSGDEKENDLKALKTELLITSAENQALDQLKLLLKKYKGSPLEPDLRLRLAELYMRRSKTERFFEINRSSPTLVSFIAPLAKSAASKEAVHLAIDVYDKIAKDFPRYSKMDTVYFNNAFARQEIGQNKEPENLYLAVIKNFPDSPLIPDCHLAVGEIEFDRHNFKLALDHFQIIQEYPNSPVYPYGIYKGAWSLYNLKDNHKALTELEKVVAFGKMVEEKNFDQRLDLRKEALADMTIFYEDDQKANDAYHYFSTQAKKEEMPDLLLKLSGLYQRHSRHEDRKILLLDFVRKLSDSDQLPEAYDGLVHTYEDMRNRKEAVSSLQSFDRVCDSSKLEKCKIMLSEAALQLGSKWLRTWKKNQTFTEFASASEKAFEIYLKVATPSHEKDEARFAYSELLFQLGKFREASNQYALTAPALVKEPMGHDAAYGALLSLEKAVGEKWNDADETQFKKLALFYTTNFPQAKYTLDIRFKQGLIAYGKDHFDEAAPLFLELGRKYAKEEKGLKSQDLYLDILNIKKDYAGLKQTSGDLLKLPATPDRIAKLQKIYRESYFIQIQKMEEAATLKEAAIEYKKFAKENNQSDLAPKAWWNAMQIEFRTGRYGEAAITAEAYFDQFPKANQSVEALLKSAETFEAMGQLDPAARVLIKLSGVDPKNAMKWKTMAADFMVLCDQKINAQKIYEELIRQQEDKKISSYALDKNMALKKALLNPQDYHLVLEGIARGKMQPQASIALVTLTEEILAKGDNTKAFSQAKDVMNMGDQASSEAKARARFIQAEILEDEFVKASVKARLERLGTVLAIKTEKLDKAQQAFQSVVRFGEPKTTIQSLKHLANCYTHYVQALKTMPAPEGMSAPEEQAFRAEVDKLSIPLEEKGVETIAQALETAKKMRIYDGTVASLQSQLDQMNMKKREEFKVEFSAPPLTLPQGMGT